MSANKRIETVYRKLSAADRIRLLLQSVRGGTDPDPLLFKTVPLAQYEEFERRVRLVLQHGREFAARVEWLGHYVDEFFLKMQILRAIRAYDAQRDLLRIALGMIVPEPISRDRYEALQRELRVRGAAETGSREPDDAAIGIDLEQTRDLPQLLALRKLLQEFGSAAYDPADEIMGDVLQDSVIPTPARAAYFEIYPVGATAQVESMRAIYDEMADFTLFTHGELPDICVEGLTEELRWLWRALRCFELAAERIADRDLGGESLLQHRARLRLGKMRDVLLSARDVLQDDGQPVELREPTSKEVAALTDKTQPLRAIVMKLGGRGVVKTKGDPGEAASASSHSEPPVPGTASSADSAQASETS